MAPRHLIALCTCPDAATASTIARRLVEERLAACVNRVEGVTSTFRWEGQVEEDTECLLVIKTVEEVYPALEKRIKAMHPYELPEIIAVPITTGATGYLRWIEESIGPG